jgi:hypothetical protein
MASKTKRVSTDGKTYPWHIISCLTWVGVPTVYGPANDPIGYRGWLLRFASPKDDMGNLIYLISVRDSAKSGLGCPITAAYTIP